MRGKMKSIVQQVQVLTSMVYQIQGELNDLKGSDANIRLAHTQLGSDRAVLSRLELGRTIAQHYPSNTAIIPSTAPNDEASFDVPSVGKDMKSIAGPITYRETQILNYVANGHTNKQIAYILRISEQTIKNHISAILRKLHANDRAHAVALAMRGGWLPAAERECEGAVPVS
jgi:DNA-binding NarL/FixJ family response regulator